jgi:tetratricopeptide (TPR) repeat protein
MNTKSKLQTFFNSKRENFEYIEMYEKNKDYFNELLKNGHADDIEFALSIKMFNYADPLNHSGDYKKALTVLYEIERDLDKIKGLSKWYKKYFEHVIFLKGVCLGRLKKYNASNIEFKKILKIHPSNDKYMDWYKSNLENRIINILNTIAIIGVSYYLCIIVFEFTGFKIKNIVVRHIGFGVAIISYLLTLIIGKIIKMKKIEIK